jgi:hypothetical protein
MAGRSEPFRAPGRFGSGCPKVAPARCSKPPSGRAPPLNQGPTDTRPLGPPGLLARPATPAWSLGRW